MPDTSPLIKFIYKAKRGINMHPLRENSRLNVRTIFNVFFIYRDRYRFRLSLQHLHSRYFEGYCQS